MSSSIELYNKLKECLELSLKYNRDEITKNLILALSKIIIDENWYDKEVESWCDFLKCSFKDT